jgi:putative membrane protein insertion efficiency factor
VRTYIKLMLAKIALTVIRLYQRFLSPAFSSACRFSPSCSNYAYQAIDKYGIVKGLFLTVRRVLRCHPFNPGGEDPIP